MRLIKDFLIDEKPIVIPDEDADLERNDLDAPETGRDESGYMHRIVLRHRVRSWSFSYSHITAEEYQYMNSLLYGKDSFRFTYKDIDGTSKVTNAYCSSDGIVYRNARTNEYRNFKIKIIEC